MTNRKKLGREATKRLDKACIKPGDTVKLNGSNAWLWQMVDMGSGARRSNTSGRFQETQVAVVVAAVRDPVARRVPGYAPLRKDQYTTKLLVLTSGNELGWVWQDFVDQV